MSGDRAESWKLGSIGDPSGPEIGHFRTAVGQSWGNPGRRDAESDPVQQALASAIQAAAAAGRFDVVTQLAKELEAHRLERVGRLSK
jgi:hypothetical protein